MSGAGSLLVRRQGEPLCASDVGRRGERGALPAPQAQQMALVLAVGAWGAGGAAGGVRWRHGNEAVRRLRATSANRTGAGGAERSPCRHPIAAHGEWLLRFK